MAMIKSLIFMKPIIENDLISVSVKIDIGPVGVLIIY